MIRSAVSSDRLNEILEASSEVNVSSINKNQSQTNNRDTQADIRERVLQNIGENSASDSYLYQRYKESLVKDDVLNNYEEIIKGNELGDKKLIAELTKDGSNIEDWSKMESKYSYTNEYGTGKIHYYMNVKTGKVSYYDAKMKISAPKLMRGKLNYTKTDKDGFWIIDLDENLIPIGVR
jgi:hypothetical protein